MEYIGSVSTLPSAVWIRNVEWPMKVTTAGSRSRCGGLTGATSIHDGHAVRGSSIIRGTAVIGCSGWPPGLKKRRPSKWSLMSAMAANGGTAHRPLYGPAPVPQLCTHSFGLPVPSSVPLMYQFLPSGS